MSRGEPIFIRRSALPSSIASPLAGLRINCEEPSLTFLRLLRTYGPGNDTQKARCIIADCSLSPYFTRILKLTGILRLSG